MDKPVITAFITVTLWEEAASFNPSEAPTPQFTQDKDDAKDKSTLLGMESADKEQELMNEVAGKATCATTEEEYDSSEEYICCIVEEPPSPANDK